METSANFLQFRGIFRTKVDDVVLSQTGQCWKKLRLFCWSGFLQETTSQSSQKGGKTFIPFWNKLFILGSKPLFTWRKHEKTSSGFFRHTILNNHIFTSMSPHANHILYKLSIPSQFTTKTWRHPWPSAKENNNSNGTGWATLTRVHSVVQEHIAPFPMPHRRVQVWHFYSITLALMSVLLNMISTY